MENENISKGTKLLASYAFWSYQFNKKIKHRFNEDTKTFLSNNDSINYKYLLKATKKATRLHNIYLFIIFIIGSFITIKLVSILNVHDDYNFIDKGALGFIIILVFFSWVITFIYNLIKYKKIFNYEKTINNIESNDLRIPSDNQNICFFSGNKPFIGSGYIAQNYSFVISIDKIKKETDKEIIDFTEDEIYNFFCDKFSSNYLTKQKLYASGIVLNKYNQDLLPVIDTGILIEEQWEKYSKYNSEDIRRYIQINTTNKVNEIEINTFIRFVKSNNNLCIEISTTKLLPIAKKYRVIEQLPKSISFARFVLIFQTSFLSTIINVPMSLIYGMSFIFTTLPIKFFGNNAVNKQIKENPLFDFGEEETLREEVADTTMQTYYNSMDSEHISKQIEKAFFTYLITFIDSKNIDTSELTQQQTTIINNGLMMSGGEVKADNLAVGSMSKILGKLK